jgi:hypothetical protein
MRIFKLLLAVLGVLALFTVFGAAQDKQSGDAKRDRDAAWQREAARKAEDVARQRAQIEIRAAQAQQAIQLQAQQAIQVQGVLAARPQQVWPDDQFERYVFQQDQSAERARHKFESMLTSRVDELERTCELTLTQMRKLQLMGHGDIKRFFDNYERAKARFKAVNNDVNRLQEIQPDLAPLRVALQGGPFTDDSLLCKSLHTTLTDEQLTKYDTFAAERRVFRHRANVELAVSMLEQAMPLRQTQRRELIALLEKETSPPKKGGQYEAYLILNQMTHLPEAKLKAILSDTQKLVLDRQLATYAVNLMNFRQSGLVADEDLAFPVPALAPLAPPVPGRLAPPAAPKK